MIVGMVNSSLEPILRLRVRNRAGLESEFDAVVDTGFNGFLTVSLSLVEGLSLPWVTREQGVLADGEVGDFDVHAVEVQWDGKWIAVEADAVDAQPLLGMALMEGFRLSADVWVGGSVTLNSVLPPKPTFPL